MENNEFKTHEKHPRKKWGTVLKGENSWTMFKVISEFVEGFELLRKHGLAVSVFGSARMRPGDPWYKESEKLASKLAKKGFAEQKSNHSGRWYKGQRYTIGPAAFCPDKRQKPANIGALRWMFFALLVLEPTHLSRLPGGAKPVSSRFLHPQNGRASL